MVYFYVITLLAVIASVSASSTSGNDSSNTCLSTSSLKFIEQALANISNQLGCFGTRDPSDVGESLTGVTSLLQHDLINCRSGITILNYFLLFLTTPQIILNTKCTF